MDSSEATGFVPDTLSASSDHNRMSDPQPSCIPTTLSKASSFSKLNAKAAEFVPRVSLSSASASSSSSLNSSGLSSPSSSVSDLSLSFGVPRPQPLLHVYNGCPPPAGWAYGYNPSLQFYNGPGTLLDRPLEQQDRSVVAAATLGPTLTPSAAAFQVISDAVSQPAPVKNGLAEDISMKIVNQVEFYFSDVNLATTGFLFKIMSKDPEGYVPLSAVASIKKIKTFSKSLSELGTVLRNSSKLVVSDDGKKVKRRHPLTELDIEEVQSRIVIAENLPEDHCHHNLMKIFSAVGSVKSIRACQPSGQSSMPKAAKTDGMNFSNKVHAFVEYESSEVAEKAVAKLNEDNWRNGLKVRLLLKQTMKSPEARVKRNSLEGNATFKEEDAFALSQQQVNELDDSMIPVKEHVSVEHIKDKDAGRRKNRSRETNENRNSGKGHGRGRSSYMNRGNTYGVTSTVCASIEQTIVSKQPSGPRMPDGTRGFSVGRGKPIG